MANDQMSEIEKRVDAFLDDLATSGEFEDFQGVITGWTLWVDRLAAKDGEKWWSCLARPEQTGTLTIGHARCIEMATANIGGFASE